MGGPPPGPPMGEDPMMALMGNEAALGQGGMERGMEGGMSIEEDANALAEAVVGRAKGDIGAAVAILDTAKEMLMASGGQDPMMEQPMMAADGRYLSDRDLAPLTQSGRSLSDRDLESLAMEAAISHSQTGRTISDKDLEFHRQMHSGRTMSDRDRSGRTMSDRDISYSDLIRKNREDLLYDQGKA
tara:strand:- start:9 stop:566 length:558 start_codon:yes stop_codon:yes gene_type:complete